MTHVQVKDFGPIAEASVELKPLTVFMGPNNSGKSYFALAIYCLSRTLSGEPALGGMGTNLLGLPRKYPFSPEILRQARAEMKKAWPTARSLPSGPIKVRDMSNGLQEVLLNAAWAFANAFSSDLARELERCYGTDIGGLVRKRGALNAASLNIGISQPDDGIAWEMQTTAGHITTTKLDSTLLERTIDIREDGFTHRELIEEPNYLLVRMMSDPNLLSSTGLPRRSYYMPASRSGIMLGHRTLAGLIIGQASRAWLDPIEIPRLPGAVTDLIKALLLLDPGKPSDAQLSQAISFLETSVARGNIDMDRSTEYPDVYYENDTGRFSLHQVSSMVSEIAPIVLYLKHLVREGHLFIIEEPESHLDAANQMKLARAIAMLVNAGVYVLITTHSDFFVKQLDNLLLVSQLTPRRRAARKYSATEVLQPSDVGAYMFEPGPEGSIVRTLEVTADRGIPTEPFSEAHADLYDEAIALEHSSR